MEQPTSPRVAPRKSVTFTAEQEVVEPDGIITRLVSSNDSKETAVSHTFRTPPLTTTFGSAADPSASSVDQTADEKEAMKAVATTASKDAQAEDVGLDLTMKKKKKKKKKADDETADGADADDGAISEPTAAPASAAVDDGGLDLTMKKKRKKKVEDDFTAKLKKLEIDGSKNDSAADGAEGGADNEGDMAEGTGLWAHNESRPISYDLMLSRFFVMLSQKHPDHALSGSRSYKIPPPLCMREGNKKTIFANLAEICKRMKRSEDHVTAYLFAELGTSGSTDGSRRLVIKGRFQQKQIEAVLRTYIMEYVTCATCRSADTELSKGENRLYFITCNSCGSRRSVLAIKTGFSAQVGKRRKM